MDIQKVKKVGGYVAVVVVLLGALIAWFIQPNNEFSDNTQKPIYEPTITYAQAPIKADGAIFAEKTPQDSTLTNTINAVPEGVIEIHDDVSTVKTPSMLDENSYSFDKDAVAEDLPVSQNAVVAPNIPSFYDQTRALSKTIELQKLLNEQSNLLALAKAKEIETERLVLSLKVAKKQAETILNLPAPTPVQKKQAETILNPLAPTPVQKKQGPEKEKTTKAVVKKKPILTENYSDVKLLALFPSDSTAVVMINGTEHAVHEGYQSGSLSITAIQWRSHTMTIKEHGRILVIKLNSDRAKKQNLDGNHSHDS